MIGAIIGIIFSESSAYFSAIVIPIAAGGFIYIAGSDLVPEMHKNQEKSFPFKNLIGIILGILLMYALTFLKVI
jgi:zinc and cadmium transporter